MKDSMAVNALARRLRLVLTSIFLLGLAYGASAAPATLHASMTTYDKVDARWEGGGYWRFLTNSLKATVEEVEPGRDRYSFVPTKAATTGTGGALVMAFDKKGGYGMIRDRSTGEITGVSGESWLTQEVNGFLRQLKPVQLSENGSADWQETLPVFEGRLKGLANNPVVRLHVEQVRENKDKFIVTYRVSGLDFRDSSLRNGTLDVFGFGIFDHRRGISEGFGMRYEARVIGANGRPARVSGEQVSVRDRSPLFFALLRTSPALKEVRERFTPTVSADVPNNIESKEHPPEWLESVEQTAGLIQDYSLVAGERQTNPLWLAAAVVFKTVSDIGKFATNTLGNAIDAANDRYNLYSRNSVIGDIVYGLQTNEGATGLIQDMTNAVVGEKLGNTIGTVVSDGLTVAGFAGGGIAQGVVGKGPSWLSNVVTEARQSVQSLEGVATGLYDGLSKWNLVGKEINVVGNLDANYWGYLDPDYWDIPSAPAVQSLPTRIPSDVVSPIDMGGKDSAVAVAPASGSPTTGAEFSPEWWNYYAGADWVYTQSPTYVPQNGSYNAYGGVNDQGNYGSQPVTPWRNTQFGNQDSTNVISAYFDPQVMPISPQLQIQSQSGEPVLTQSSSNGELVYGTIGTGNTFDVITTATTTASGSPVVTAVSARASQSYSMFVDPMTGQSVPDMTTLNPQTSAEAVVLTTTEASQGTGRIINSAADAAAYITATTGAYFHSDFVTGIYWGYVDAGPDANGLYVDAGKHYIFGPPVSNMPTSGTATYTFLGSTVPSITLGGNASSGSGSGNSFTSGNFTANFSASTLTTPTMVMNIAANGSIPALTLSMAGGQTIAYGGANTAQNIAVTCTGGCTSGVAGNINTRFTGNGASGLAVSITAYGGAVPVTNGGTTINVPLSAAVVAAYKKQ